MPLERRGGEWETDYDSWDEVYLAWPALLASVPFDEWDDALVSAALFALARDNEAEFLAAELEQCSGGSLAALARRALDTGEPEARWQLAVRLAVRPLEECEPLLLRFVVDANEYVRRRALQSLARVGSARVEAIAWSEWERAPDDMPWTRMNVLWVLHRIRSSRLEEALAIAERPTSHELLRGFAAEIRRGDVRDA